MMDNSDFIKFIHSFDEDFLMPVCEISRSESGRKEKLVENSTPMYAFDDICRNSRRLSKNLPKTCDALQYRLDGEKLKLFVIEFKFFNIDSENSNYVHLDAAYNVLKNKNKPSDYLGEKCISDRLLKNFEKIRDNFVDSVEVSLRLKPYETLMLALPGLYEEYCHRHGSSKDFRRFMENVDVELYVVVHKLSDVRNISSQRLFPHSIKNSLNRQYSRMISANVISRYDIIEASDFEELINRKNLSDS